MKLSGRIRVLVRTMVSIRVRVRTMVRTMVSIGVRIRVGFGTS